MTKVSFEITVPVLNEESGLNTCISTLHDHCTKQYPDSGQWRIVIADNGSTDGTRDIGERLASDYENISYIRLERRGIGLALKTSWHNASARIIGSMDLDLSTDLRHLPEAIAAISEKGYDLVYATRLHKDSRVAGRSLRRECISRSFNMVLRNYLKVPISDAMCGFTFFKRSLLERIIENGAVSDGWFFQAEVLVVSEWLGLRIFELPVSWTDDDQSKVRVVPLAIEYLRAMKDLKHYSPGRK